MTDSVDQFIARGSPEQQALLGKLEALITSLYPDAERLLWYGMPTWRVSKHGWVCLNYWKDGVTLLTKEPDAVAAFKAAHPKIKVNKASINLRLTGEFPAEGLSEVIRTAMSAA